MWRVLGVAVLLLALGLVGGYAVAGRDEPTPVATDRLEPVPAVSPAVPTPTQYAVNPDPDRPALQPDLPSEPVELRQTKRGAGISVPVPVGWRSNRLTDSSTWIFVSDGYTNTYNLRVDLTLGRRTAGSVLVENRLDALRSSQEDGNLQDLEITAQTDMGFEADYIIGGYRRYTVERFVDDSNGLAIADVAVTGRLVDLEAMRDLLSRTVDGVTELAPLPKPTESPLDSASDSTSDSASDSATATPSVSPSGSP